MKVNDVLAEVDAIAEANERMASMTPEELGAELISMREKVIASNQETLAKIRAHGADLDNTFGLAARIEALVDIMLPEQTLGRLQYDLSVEVHLAAAFAAALEQVSKPQLLVPGK